MSKLIKIALVEDDRGFREALEDVFDMKSGFQVVASCENGEAALRRIPGTGCEFVVMDINLPGMSGIECLRQLKSREPGLCVTMLTSFDDDDNLFQSLVAGADGFLLKRTERHRLVDAVRDIIAGGAPISPQIARRMVGYFHQIAGEPKRVQDRDGNAPELADLTPREKEVLELLARGFTPKEVAAKLAIGWQTVRTYMKSIYEKLHVHNRTDAILKFLGKQPSSELPE